MSLPPRSIYHRPPGQRITERPPVDGIALRPLDDSDDAVLGRLMERAYAGTIDESLGDNSDGAVEIAGWRERAVPEASFVAIKDDGVPVAASLVAEGTDNTYWIAYVITDPGWKGRGLGTAVVAASLGVLDDAAVFAGVTDGNTPSERLLTSLGFVRTGPA
ncbi:GNAT family N-acetyltransferase [Allokutzneria sp. A3M-2-11 16]|uniref:GNAT family N-acetyltransferase n=1 Tax=Allokutzneria sp. A3M-2-11 16 TaxID=2962043 RepID=UPI0020B6B724|nr:GNAT family N-acetyltransferase [Allokutzneria sp. A3M-2-11 16]MCP3804422.1 GNAT family N-acetyltransferase [Allokutzneria sp. A3M-2-11 16]